jgi:hypothetical protein
MEYRCALALFFSVNLTLEDSRTFSNWIGQAVEAWTDSFPALALLSDRAGMPAGQPAALRGKEAVSEAQKAVRNISRREKLVMLDVIVADTAGVRPPALSSLAEELGPFPTDRPFPLG